MRTIECENKTISLSDTKKIPLKEEDYVVLAPEVKFDLQDENYVRLLKCNILEYRYDTTVKDNEVCKCCLLLKQKIVRSFSLFDFFFWVKKYLNNEIETIKGTLQLLDHPTVNSCNFQGCTMPYTSPWTIIIIKTCSL